MWIEARDTARHRPGTWEMSGMQATRSGDFDCTGLGASADQIIGSPDCYTTEPWFIGGVWRIAAVQLGGTLGLLNRARDDLRRRGHLEAELQIARLAPVAIRAVAAAAHVKRAGAFADGPAGQRAPERAAVLSAAARLLTEEIGQSAIASVEQSVGLSLFRTDDETGCCLRDLAAYMRQAARDALLQRAGRFMLLGEARLSDLCDE